MIRSSVAALLLSCVILSCSRSGLDTGSAVTCPSSCDDGLFCNGDEACDATTGRCIPAANPTRCDDNDECTIDSCDESLDRCTSLPTPRDEDGDTYDACNNDCDDQNAAVHPGATELCNEIDDDCDRAVDENLISECGDCRPGCHILEAPRDDVRQPPGEVSWILEPESASAVAVNERGDLVLTSESTETYFAWIANNGDSKVTKLDTRDGSQVAVYDSVLLGPSTHPPSLDAPCESDDESGNVGNCPSRTAVDLNGAVYVANRAFGRQGTVTKIAGFEDDCLDRNGNGMIDTSRDVSGNGRIERLTPGEYLAQRDECILWTVDVGANNGVPRGLAVDASGNVWVGLHHEQRLLQLDPSDGHVLRSIPLPAFKPYGAAVDRRGTVWLSESLTGQILGVNGETGELGRVLSAPSPQEGCPSSYGIATDSKSRVWLAGFTCPFAFRYDPEANRWASFAMPEGGVTRGIAARDDGTIFVAASHDWVRIDLSASNPLQASDEITRLTVFNGDDGSNLRTFGTEDEPILGRGSIGVGLDTRGRAWLVNQQNGTATVVNIETGAVDRYAAGSDPYTYSDFTGYALRRITAPTGFVRSILEGCPIGPTEWESLSWDARVPAGARLEIRVRTADSRDALTSAMWQGPWDASPIDFLAAATPPAELRFMEIESRLVSVNEAASPALTNLVVQIHCPLEAM